MQKQMSGKRHRRIMWGTIVVTCSLWALFWLGMSTGRADSGREAQIVGTVKNRPTAPTVQGTWQIERENKGSVTLFTVVVDGNTELDSKIPDIGDVAEIQGFWQGNNVIRAKSLKLKDHVSGSDDDIYGWVLATPDTGEVGAWEILERQDVTRTVIATANTRFDHGIPRIGEAVEVRGTRQSDGTVLARRIRPDAFELQQVIARLKPGVLSSTVASRFGLTPLATVLASGSIYLFSTSEDDETNAVERLKNDTEHVIWAELNYVGRVPVGNPKRAWNWGGVDNSGYVNQAAFAQIDLGPALQRYHGDGVTVAVLDTGADLSHEALVGHFVDSSDMWDMVADDAVPQDEGVGLAWGHGTHIAGVIAHIAPASKIMPIRVLDANGRGNTTTLAYAIEWAVKHGAKVVNLSLGAEFDSQVLSTTIHDALAQGVFVAAAAGNDNVTIRQYPAGYAGVVGVTAINEANVKADFANYGTGWVDIAAPGVGITSSIIGPQGSGYASWSGTSMSTAFVSGAAALLRQELPTADVATLTNLLQKTAHNLDGANPSYAGQLGGLLDLGAAVDAGSPPIGTPTPIPAQQAKPIYLPGVKSSP